MKAILIVVGSLGGIYAVVALIQFIRVIRAHPAGTAYGIATIAASVFPICLGFIVCIACFQQAFRRM